MRRIRSIGELVVVDGLERSLTYRPRRITIDDGTWVAHESRGGGMSSVWATDLGDRFIEVVHLGHGPVGGELVVVVPDADTVLLGDLYTATEPETVRREWPPAVDLALGLTSGSTRILTSSGQIERDALEACHQSLLGWFHG